MDILGTIPHRPPFLFVDKVLSCDDLKIVAERKWRGDEAFYKGHYPENPITPGVLLCESVFQTAALLMAEREKLSKDTVPGHPVPVLARIQNARFRRMIKPGQTAIMEVTHKETLKGFHFLEGKVTVDGKTALALEFSLTLVQEDNA